MREICAVYGYRGREKYFSKPTSRCGYGVIFSVLTLDSVSLFPWSSLMSADFENVSYLNY